MYGNRISKRIIDMYDINIGNEQITVQNPSYINIYIDNRFKIVNTEHVIRISNNRVSVTLWKRNKIMHITVFK